MASNVVCNVASLFSALAKYKLNFPFKDNGLANFYAPQDGVEMPLSSFVILSKNENIIPSGQKTPVPLGERTSNNIDIPQISYKVRIYYQFLR